MTVTVSAGAIIGFRIYSTQFPNGTDRRQLFEKMIDVTQMTCRVCSLIANLIATSIIARWVWYVFVQQEVTSIKTNTLVAVTYTGVTDVMSSRSSG